MNRYYITTAIDYANGAPHLGHTFEKVLADVMARFQRLSGVETLFQMGMDEHGQKVEQTAAAAGISPQQFVDDMAATYERVWKAMDISHDSFFRTTSARHAQGVQALFQRCFEQGDIYKGSYEGLYCVGCEAFYLERDLVEGKCPTHGTPPRAIQEENYFFRLSKYAEPLLQHIEAHPECIEPEIRRNEVLNVIRSGLEDVSVSRANIKWGIPLPMDPSHTIYVWFDALANYATGVGLGASDEASRAQFAKWWPADCHVIGKDITRFHCVIWPAMMLSVGEAVPRQVFAHGWLQSEGGERFSKSAGNVVDPLKVGEELLRAAPGLREDLALEPLRYYLCREVPMGGDGVFTWERFVERYNADLANELGNLLNRALSMTHRYFGGQLPEPAPNTALEDQLSELAREVIASHARLMHGWQQARALEEVWRLVKRANQYVQETEPWTLAKDPANFPRLARVLSTPLECLRVIAALLAPVLPRSAATLGADLGLADWPIAHALEALEWRTEPRWGPVRPAAVLFPRVQAPKPAAAKP